jgi:hypothetical protein
MVPFQPLSAKASLPEMESAFMDFQVYYHSVYFTSHWPASGICCSTSVLRALEHHLKEYSVARQGFSTELTGRILLFLHFFSPSGAPRSA